MEDSFSYEVRRSNRRTLALQLGKDGRLVVRAPLFTPETVIRNFVRTNEPWIRSQLQKYAQRVQEQQQLPSLSAEELADLTARAKAVIPRRVAYYAPLVGVTYGRVTIRHQKSKWGSCSSTGNLNFNCLLMLAPAEVLDSVVVHELCHRKVMNHSPRFYAEVLRVFPSYRQCDQWLKKNGHLLLSQLPD